ncbi:MAG: hypothetical protein H6697_05950 [Myxococcales bacterium]|nr:hypothetical protein [Myxococcales bacterium]
MSRGAETSGSTDRVLLATIGRDGAAPRECGCPVCRLVAAEARRSTRGQVRHVLFIETSRAVADELFRAVEASWQPRSRVGRGARSERGLS